jgi:hypothetical protein
MSLFAESTGGSFKPVPAGLHLARCYRIIDLGTQKSEYEGKVNFLRKIKVVWEVHGTDDDGTPIVTDKGEPFIITKDYTLSWGEKANLRKDLQAWRGKPFSEDEQRRFELKNVLDRWCMINVQHKPRRTGDGVYANVMGVTPVASALKGTPMPKGFNPAQMFTLGEPDMDMFETFGDYLKEQIKQSPEWKALFASSPETKTSKGADDDFGDDEIPF